MVRVFVLLTVDSDTWCSLMTKLDSSTVLTVAKLVLEKYSSAQAKHVFNQLSVFTNFCKFVSSLVVPFYLENIAEWNEADTTVIARFVLFIPPSIANNLVSKLSADQFQNIRVLFPLVVALTANTCALPHVLLTAVVPFLEAHIHGFSKSNVELIEPLLINSIGHNQFALAHLWQPITEFAKTYSPALSSYIALCDSSYSNKLATISSMFHIMCILYKNPRTTGAVIGSMLDLMTTTQNDWSQSLISLQLRASLLFNWMCVMSRRLPIKTLVLKKRHMRAILDYFCSIPLCTDSFVDMMFCNTIRYMKRHMTKQEFASLFQQEEQYQFVETMCHVKLHRAASMFTVAGSHHWSKMLQCFPNVAFQLAS